ncbi:phage tailspike protein [Pantoea eucrina]|uniref:phage tailspike protein n=1 Tax=Pantoea eucrina TaxID=472693 RepID=UPI000A23769C|nr:phage tailspike protein [Pantoea eucrina]ORM78353.1 hypothetical protein HA43_08395 [Pantoea eucrina]
MADTTTNVVVASALQIFTASRSFKALANGKIFIGIPDTDPTLPGNQKTVFVHNENGDALPVAQPIVINAGGHAVYAGQPIRKLTTEGNFSMAIYDAYGALEFYFDDMSKYDSDVLLGLLTGSGGASIIGNGNDTLNHYLPHTPEEFLVNDIDLALASSLSATASDGRKTIVAGDRTLNSTVTIPQKGYLNVSGTLQSLQSLNLPAIAMDSNSTLSGAKILTPNRALAIRVDGKSNVEISGVKAKGTFVTNDENFAYGVDILNSTDVYVKDVQAEGYTGGLSFSESKRVMADGLNFSGMKFHPSLGAGDYGVLYGNNKNGIISRLFYKASADGYGRHGFYMAGHDGSVNTVLNGAVFDYSEQPAGIQPPGAINIRKNDRAVYANIVIDGTGITGITENGYISTQIFNGIMVNQVKRGSAIAYGINLGESTGALRVRNCVFSAYIVTIALAYGVTDPLCYGVVVSGSDNKYNGYTRIPNLGYPYLVQNGATDCLIEGCLDTAEASGGQAFIIFAGSASRITIKGCSTRRPWFRSGNLNSVTDLTVDFPRSTSCSINSGTPTYADPYELVSGTTVGNSNIVVSFKGHVTQAAVDNAVASFFKSSTLVQPVITSRANKSMVIEFYSLTNGALVNPSTTAVGFTLTINQ